MIDILALPYSRCKRFVCGVKESLSIMQMTLCKKHNVICIICDETISVNAIPAGFFQKWPDYYSEFFQKNSVNALKTA